MFNFKVTVTETDGYTIARLHDEDTAITGSSDLYKVLFCNKFDIVCYCANAYTGAKKSRQDFCCTNGLDSVDLSSQC